jgi:hypothetical protein
MTPERHRLRVGISPGDSAGSRPWDDVRDRGASRALLCFLRGLVETLFWYQVHGAYSEKRLDGGSRKAIAAQQPDPDRVGKFLPDRCLLIIGGAKERR